jgi:hypothetical protein
MGYDLPYRERVLLPCVLVWDALEDCSKRKRQVEGEDELHYTDQTTKNSSAQGILHSSADVPSAPPTYSKATYSVSSCYGHVSSCRTYVR